MRIAFAADCHIGNHRRFGGPETAGVNVRGALTLDAFRAAYRTALAERCSAFVVAGDVFDEDCPSPQVLAAVQDILNGDGEVAPSAVPILLVGNHDQHSTAIGDHALGPLGFQATIVDSPAVQVLEGEAGEVVAVLSVPYDPRPAGEWLAETVAGLASSDEARGSTSRVLAVHLGISDEHTPAFLRGARDAVDVATIAKVAAAAGCSHVFAGNWHDRKQWSRHGVHVVQCGALVPTGFDNPGLHGYGGLHVLDTAGVGTRVTSHEVPGPRFVTVDGPDALRRELASARAKRCRVFARVRAGAGTDEVAAAQDAIAAGLGGDVLGGEVDLDRTEATAAARTAAHAARKSETLSEALARFVGAMPLDEGVDRAEVLRRATACLG